MKPLKHLTFDIIGILLVVISPFFGWLPGPGGIPIFLAGLGLLSVHHKWARRLLKEVKTQGLKLNEQIFRDHPTLQAAYDIISVGLTVGGIYLLNTYTRNLTLTFAIFLLFTGAALFFGNRKRLEAFTKWLKNKLR